MGKGCGGNRRKASAYTPPSSKTIALMPKKEGVAVVTPSKADGKEAPQALRKMLDHKGVVVADRAPPRSRPRENGGNKRKASAYTPPSCKRMLPMPKKGGVAVVTPSKTPSQGKKPN